MLAREILTEQMPEVSTKPPVSNKPKAAIQPDNPFTYNWGNYMEKTFTNEQTKKLSPQELLLQSATGAKITGAQFIGKARDLKDSIANNPKKYGEDDLRTLHELYQKASDTFLSESLAGSKSQKVKQAFTAQAEAAKYAPPLLNKESPLYDMKKAVQKGQDSQKNNLFPAHFTGLGGHGILKEGSIHAFNRTIDGENVTQIGFKLSKFARSDLQTHLTAIIENPEAFAIAAESLGAKVTINEDIHIQDKFLRRQEDGTFSKKNGASPGGAFPTPWKAQAIQIEFSGMGSVIIGNTPRCSTLYSSVKVIVNQDLNKGEGQNIAHQMLSMVGLGPIMHPQDPIDEERLKVAKLFRAYFPQEAVKMERTKDFYELPLPLLIEKIRNFKNEDGPTMYDLLKKYDIQTTESSTKKSKKNSLIQKVEVFPGKEVFAVTDISSQMRTSGAHGLMAGVGSDNANDASDSIVKMVNSGAMSGEDLYEAGLIGKKASPSGPDSQSGGFNRVFTRLITQSNCQANLMGGADCPLPLKGVYQVLYDLDAVNTGAYAYTSDLYGVNNPQHENYHQYENRDNLIKFSQKVVSESEAKHQENAILSSERNKIMEERKGLEQEKEKKMGAPSEEQKEELKKIDDKLKENTIKENDLRVKMRENRGVLYENEVMIKNTIPPQMIRGIVCQTQDNKDLLIQKLRKSDFVKKNKINLDNFIHVADNFDEQMWKTQGGLK